MCVCVCVCIYIYICIYTMEYYSAIKDILPLATISMDLNSFRLREKSHREGQILHDLT